MILLNKLRPFASHCKTGCATLTLSRTVQFVHRLQTAVPQQQKADVVAHLSEKLCCTEYVAKNIYSKFPSLRSIDVIKNDTLELLRSKLSPQTIIENPSLITANIKTVTRKIDLLNSLKPRKLDDFAPLLTLDEDELTKLVARFLKEKHEIEQNNRIYFLSEKLKLEPKVITKHRANCGYELFFSSFRSFKKKINIVLDYGVSPMNILKGLYVLRCDDDIFVRRSERMLSVGLPIKMWYFQLPEEEFGQLIEKHNQDGDSQKSALSARMARWLKKRNRDKATIVETLNSLLKCDNSVSSEIYYNYVNETSELNYAKRNVAYLLKINFKLETIRENGFLLPMPLIEIEDKLSIIKSMEPINVADFIPLMNADTSELENYKYILEEYNAIGSNHPIYHFSEKLEMPISMVAARFTENRAIFFKNSPDLLESKLNVMLKHDVDRASILKCQYTFKLSVHQIEEIICKLKNDGLDRISSWMIIPKKSPEHNKLVSIHKREKDSLEGCESNMAYLAHRLGWDDYDLTIALEKYPRLRKCTASSIKKHLDYLLNETKFAAVDITYSPYILLKSIDEIKARIDEMTKIGAPITLPVIYQGKTKYMKCIRQYCVTQLKDKETDVAFAAIEERLKQQKSQKYKNK